MADEAPSPLPPFSGFSDLYDPLARLLDQIRTEGPKGKPLPKKSASGKPLPILPPHGVTDTSAKAYGITNNKATTVIKPIVDQLSDEAVGFLSGLGFTDPNDVVKQRTDVVNSIHAAWDKSASEYMKLKTSAGDSARTDMANRLQEFDTAIITLGVTPVTPDQ